MNVLDTLRTAAEGLWHNGLRSLLTALGIIIGVAAVIVVLALGTGATEAVEATYRSLGSNQVSIQSYSRAPGADPVTYEEALGLEDLSLVEKVYVSLQTTKTASLGWTKLDTTIEGTTAPGAEELSDEDGDWVLAAGEAFSEADVDYLSRVCILGSAVAEEIFPGEDPLGQTIRIDNVNFRVIGVFEEKPEETTYDPNDFIRVPLSTAAEEFYTTDPSVRVTADIVSENKIDDAIDQIADYLRQAHDIDWAAGDEDDFSISTQQAQAEAAMESAETFSSLLSGLAAVSLIVGGIGIMNVMLVSVAERTREIGIRKAIGARRKDIVQQFLMEAGALGIAGGILGIAAGILTIPIIAHYSTDLTAVFTWQSVPLAFGVSFLVGIFFGFYPALRASRLDAIEALRHE